jgi:hypothetical protein
VPILARIGKALMHSGNLLMEFQPVAASLAFLLESTLQQFQLAVQLNVSSRKKILEVIVHSNYSLFET